jgi:hypothetical protein
MAKRRKERKVIENGKVSSLGDMQAEEAVFGERSFAEGLREEACQWWIVVVGGLEESAEGWEGPVGQRREPGNSRDGDFRGTWDWTKKEMRRRKKSKKDKRQRVGDRLEDDAITVAWFASSIECVPSRTRLPHQWLLEVGLDVVDELFEIFLESALWFACICCDDMDYFYWYARMDKEKNTASEETGVEIPCEFRW